MIPKSICFIDVETSGMSPAYNRIIEIGIIKVENDEIVKEYKTFLNPQTGIDPYVSMLTGIDLNDLKNAPTFNDIKDELLEILKGSTFVAHSVRFDYGFIRNEFKRVGINFRSKHFCTVKLARALYPGQTKYNLDSIIEKFNIECKNRHRAFDDAKVIYEFYRKSKKTIEKTVFEKAIQSILVRTTLPSFLPIDTIKQLPESPGVYIFYEESGEPIYIGKSVNIKDRVLSHFSSDSVSAKEMKISQQVRSIETIKTAGELGALLLESTLIKKYKPLYNRMLRESRKMIILLKTISDKGYFTVEMKELESLDVSEIGNILAVFKSLKQTKEFLYNLSKIYYLCPKILGLDKSKNSCFYYQLSMCKGACIGKELNLKYNLRFDDAFYKTKVKNWSYNGAVAIKESSEREEIHVIDKWCYLGSLKSDGEDFMNLSKDYRFDYDTYKILSKFVKNPKNQKFITPINI